MQRSWFFALALCAALASCQTPPPTEPPATTAPTPIPSPSASVPPNPSLVPGLPEALLPTSLPFETVVHSWQFVSWPEQPSKGSTYVVEQIAIQTQGELEAFFARHPGLPPAPTVDFTTRTAIATLLVPATGPTVEMTRVEDRGTYLAVHTVRWLPAPPKVAVPVVAQPFQVITIPKTTMSVFFIPPVSAFDDMRPADRPQIPSIVPSPR